MINRTAGWNYLSCLVVLWNFCSFVLSQSGFDQPHGEKSQLQHWTSRQPRCVFVFVHFSGWNIEYTANVCVLMMIVIELIAVYTSELLQLLHEKVDG